MGLSLWFQRRTNVRTTERIRRKGGRMMGMDLLIPHTVGRRSGEPRQSPLSWFADGESSRLIIASGGGKRNPDWYANLMAHPDRAEVELHGEDAVPVTVDRLEGTERDRAWRLIVEAQPRYARYQNRSDRRYPVIRPTTS